MTKTKFHLTMKIILVNYMFFSKLINDKKKNFIVNVELLSLLLFCYLHIFSMISFVCFNFYYLLASQFSLIN